MNRRSEGSAAETLLSPVYRKASLLLALATIAACSVCATCDTTGEGTPYMVAIQKMQDMFKTMGYPIALFMMVYMGAKWAIAEGPEDRENARRGIIYIVIALILLSAAPKFTTYLLC